MQIENPFHEGEVQVQERAGEAAEGERNGRVIGDSILKGALMFIAKQPLAVLGSVDDELNVWASVLVGRPGFMSTPDEQTVEFDLSQAGIHAHDPLWANIEQNTQVGALIIELATRRRVRINGEVTRSAADRLTLRVAESYPNCPKYIQRRTVEFQAVEQADALPAPVDGLSLGREQESLIQSSDTFFVASAYPKRGVDASHRGGAPGFVELVDDRTLRAPDYAGNSMFNTLGNLAVNPRAGLVFLDFDRGRTLQLIGRAEILWDQPDASHRSGGTRRFWDFRIDSWRESGLPAALRWEFLDYSPYNPQRSTSP